jgi:AcrR family transcriptional regulator
MLRKQEIVNAAVNLFALQGFDGTTTLQIAGNAGVTEPLVFYYFKNKDGLFTEIVKRISAEYAARLNKIEQGGFDGFEKIGQLINLHLNLVSEMPAESTIFARACPAKIRDIDHRCARAIASMRSRMTTYVADCLEEGVNSGEFYAVSVGDTTRLIVGLVIGLMRQEVIPPSYLTAADGNGGIKGATIDFCRRSLVKA